MHCLIVTIHIYGEFAVVAVVAVVNLNLERNGKSKI